MTLIDSLIRQATQLHSPISGTFELTARCNLSCKMCYIHNAAQDAALQKQELSTQQWIALAEQAKNAGTLILLLTGGEPMLRPDFPEIYRACFERGFLLTVNTNGTLLRDELFDLFTQCPPLRLNVSLYAMHREVYGELCGDPSAFDRVTKNLKRLRALGIAVQINFTATPYNQKELPEVQRFAEEIGAKVHYTAYNFPPTRTALPCAEPCHRFTPEEAAEATISYLRVSRSKEEFSAYCKVAAEAPPPRIDDCGEISDGVRCRAGKASYWITYEGKMLPCGMLAPISVPVLDLGMEEAWRLLVAKFAEVKMPSGCIACADYEHCEVCPAICYCETGDTSAVPEYICQKNRHYREILRSITGEEEGTI